MPFRSGTQKLITIVKKVDSDHCDSAFYYLPKIRAVEENSKQHTACKICLCICIYSYISYKVFKTSNGTDNHGKNSVIKHKICKGLSHLDHFTQPKLKSCI